MVRDGDTLDWSALLHDQADWHWQHQARPRLDGLTDEEYRWEPVPGSWNVHRRGSGAPPGAGEVGDGATVIDFGFPPPVPAPVTTIAWRLAHVVVGVLGDRNARYFGGEPVDWDGYAYPLSAAGALADLDAAYAVWRAGVRGLGDDDLRAPCREAGFESEPMAGLVLHINRELIHHLAEVALLRDLWVHGAGRRP